MKLNDIRHRGGPDEPTKPTTINKNSTDNERLVYTEAQNSYLELYKEYKAYESDEHVQLLRGYKCYKELTKLRGLLETKNKTDRVNKNIADCIEILNGIAPSRKDGETDKAYEKRSNKIISLRLADLILDTDLESPISIDEKLTDLFTQDENISLLVEKSKLINDKVKFNKSAMVTTSTVAEAVVIELIENAIRNSTSFEINKKSLQPDHAIMGNIRTLYECSGTGKKKRTIS